MASFVLSSLVILLSLAASGCKASPATTTTTGNFPVITDTEGNAPTPPTQSGTIAGADGADGGFHLSTGAIVGIAIAIAIICIAFITLWALWFTAKRHNWAVRDTLKYASRRFTGRGAVPPTPKLPRTPHIASVRNHGAGVAGRREHALAANRKAGYRYGGSNDDVERQWPTAAAAGMGMGNKKTQVGWPEEEQEKDISRSVTPSSRGGRR